MLMTKRITMQALIPRFTERISIDQRANPSDK